MEMTPNIPAQKEPVSQIKVKNRDKFIHLTKRSHVSIWNALLIRVGAVLLALIVAGVITSLLTKENPLSVYAAYFEGAFGNENYTWFMITFATELCIRMTMFQESTACSPKHHL